MAEVTQADIDQAEAILRAFINENFPTVETRKGSAFRSLVISPAAAMYALILKELEQFRDSTSLANINSDLFDESVMEAFIENFLVTRNTGSQSSGILKLSVSQDKEYLVTDSTVFVTEEGLRFLPTSTTTFSSSPTEDQSQLFTESDGLTFFFLVNVRSESPSSTPIPQDTVFSLAPESFVDDALFSIIAYADFSEGTDVETIEEFRQRAIDSVSVRDLVTDKAIKAVIPENFPEVRATQPIGYGDLEMLRDIVLPQGIHKGGDVDVFVRTNELPETRAVEKAIIASLQIELEDPETPIFQIDKVELQGNGNLTLLEEGTNYTISYTSSILTEQSFIVDDLVNYYSRFSSKERVVITFLDPSLNGSRVLVTYSAPSSIQSIQDFLEDENNRVIAANLLARAMAPVFMSSTISYRVLEADKPPDEIVMAQVVRDYINSLTGLDAPKVSNIVSILEAVEGVKSIVLPVTLNANVVKTDGTTEFLSTQDKLVINSEKSIGFSQRICQYILKPEDIQFIKVIDEQ